MRLAFFLMLLFGLAGPALAQGFKTFNGRNHPELDWQVAETAHFKIMYPRHLRGIEVEAAPIAEASYAALSVNLGVTFDEKVRIYLSDEDEIANGFAVPIGNGHTNIWVRHNEWATTWTGREKWLRKVLAHELAHIFHYRAVATRSRLLNLMLGNPLPRFWTEGLAQYQTEAWDAQRGDRWLRTAVLDDNLLYTDGLSIWNGRLLYAVGNAQVRFFAEQYGDSTLAELLAHRKKTVLGLVNVHDFKAAFKVVTGESHLTFYDTWRRHLNVYYNTLAGQLEQVEKVGIEIEELPGQYLYDVQYSPETSRLAVLSLASPKRPVRRLYVVDLETEEEKIVADGAIKAPVTWSPDGQQLAFARTVRGQHGSLINDLFLVDADGNNLRRLTHSRRAVSPTFSPEGDRLAFIGSEGGTANLYVLDLETGEEIALTSFMGDIQLSNVAWHPTNEQLAFARITADGTRNLLTLDLETRSWEEVTDGVHDDRYPVWSPDGMQLAYSSLRDDVPNVFVYDITTGTHRRVTHLTTGATVHDWLPPDSAHAQGMLMVSSTVSKQRDRAYRVDASRSAAETTIRVPEAYRAWTTHRPPEEVPSQIAPDSTLITHRASYQPWKNLTKAGAVLLPYYFGAKDWGVAAGGVWLEPLAKHMLLLGGGLSIPAPRESSGWLASYVNNQLYPTLTFSTYLFPGSARFYEDSILAENYLGGHVALQWPLNSSRPYVGMAWGFRLRYIDITPINPEDFKNPQALPLPEASRQADIRLRFTWKQVRPYLDNFVHPLDGRGVRFEVIGAAPILAAKTKFIRTDLKAFHVLRTFGRHRLYVYGRAQVQAGTPRPQDYIGFPKYDALQIDLPDYIPFAFSGTDRVRGYRTFATGDRVFFGSLEYRLPLLPDLQTKILGLVSLGTTALTFFAEGGLVWSRNAYDEAVRRIGVGIEVKNMVQLGGVLKVGHAVGIAKPASELGMRNTHEFYYRIRTALPF